MSPIARAGPAARSGARRFPGSRLGARKPPGPRLRRLLSPRTPAFRGRSRRGPDDIPYHLAGAPHLAERQEVLDLVSALRLLNNPRDDLRAFAFLRSPFVCLRDEVIARLRLTQRNAPLFLQAQRFLTDGELLEQLLQGTGYRLHFLLDGHHEDALANIDAFVHFAEDYRDLDIGTFLEVWEIRNRSDNGLPQAPLYSQEDNVVTLTTIHRAKGLEWPVVFFVDVDHKMNPRTTNDLWSDRTYGPLLAPIAAKQGPRARELVRRKSLEGRAEDSRLVYVATTRARDRLILAGAHEVANTYASWLSEGVTPHHVELRTIDEAPVPDLRPNRVALAWLDAVEPSAPDGLIAPDGLVAPDGLIATLDPPPLSFIRSATDLMTENKDPEEWERCYRHGVVAPWYFAKQSAGEPAVPGTTRGTVIHGVLERIEQEHELGRILDEVIGGLDEPELAPLMAPGTSYRDALEAEIRRVVASDEWKWYVEGEHYRELHFAHLTEPQEWRIGAFDLYRPAEGDSAVIDFKTHEVDERGAHRVAAEYAVQARVYGKAASIRGPARVIFHFTGPNVQVEAE